MIRRAPFLYCALQFKQLQPKVAKEHLVTVRNNRMRNTMQAHNFFNEKNNNRLRSKGVFEWNEMPILNLSTTTKLVSNPSDCGSTLMKSMLMSSHTLSGIGKGWSKPASDSHLFVLLTNCTQSHKILNIVFHLRLVNSIASHCIVLNNPE